MILRRIRIRIFTSLFRTRSRKLYLVHRESARALVHERVRHFIGSHYGPRHGIAVGKITIRNQRSRWGSCSRRGNLNFHYKLLFMTPEEREYVIVHEICHIKEFNHGPHFWALVSERVPEYMALRRRLRHISAILPA